MKPPFLAIVCYHPETPDRRRIFINLDECRAWAETFEDANWCHVFDRENRIVAVYANDRTGGGMNWFRVPLP